MSLTQKTMKKTVWPFLVLSGVTFLAAVGIKIHAAVLAIISLYPISSIENIIGTICFFVGFASIIVLIFLIGSIYEKRKNIIITAIILLVLFISFELLIALYEGIDELGGIWGNIVLLIVYGTLRGFALRNTNETLSLPRPGYGTLAFKAYGWSFLVTTILSFILALIGGVTYSIGIITFAFWIIIIQYFFEALCLLMISIRFIQYAFSFPVVVYSDIETVPTIATKTQAPIITESPDYYQERITSEQTIETKPIYPTEEPVEFCAYCGAKLKSGSKFCDSCGETRQ